MRHEEPLSERKWEVMRLTSLGKVGDVVRQAGGKSPIPADDTGIVQRKPSGQE